MAARLGVFLLVSFLGTHGTPEIAPELIVWNVGQGQWVTVIDDQACWHFDMGGEFAPWAAIANACHHRLNRLSLSHWDLDHIVFVGRARTRLPNLCLINAPQGRASPRKEAMLRGLPHCLNDPVFAQWTDPTAKVANAKSWVVNWRGMLAPGDSTRHEEKKWIHQLAGLNQVRFLILGHHGSRTSTSMELLNSLPRLQQAICSARKRRYGHPHAPVVEALARLRIPLLRTEVWGTVHIRL